jgi:hypothetical protein
MKKLFLFLVFGICSASAQELIIPVKFMLSLKSATERYIGNDTFGAVYTISNNELQKHTEGVTLKYKALSLGEIYKVDLQNPLQIVLFYRKFNTVVLLDNQLNETTRINFSNIPQPIVAEAAGLASQNRLWLYDINTQQLGLFDLAQNSFKTITPPFTDTIRYYQNDYNYFYWLDAAGRCYAANLFGSVTFLGTISDFDRLQMVSPTQALIKKDNILYLHNLQGKTRSRIGLNEKSFESFHYAAQILTIFTGTEINQYNITFPE